MRTFLFALFLVAFAVGASRALAADFPISPQHLQYYWDGGILTGAAFGNRLTTNDGGRSVLLDTNEVNDWVAVLRCKCPSEVKYLFSFDAGIVAGAAQQSLDCDRTFDIPVRQGNTDKYRYLSLWAVDAGIPDCLAQTNR